MFVGRKKDLQLLEKQYGESKNGCIILYGRKGIGKTELVRQFIRGKEAIYYQARECSEREQYLMMKKEWGARGKTEEEGFYSLMKNLFFQRNKKFIFVIDEFHKIIKNSQEFLPALKRIWEENQEEDNLLLILTSSSVQWTENHMVKDLGEFAKVITTCRKIKEFSFLEMVNRFPKASVEECIQIYGILGGVPYYLDRWEEGIGVKENVKSLFLSKNEIFSKEVENYLKNELRELALYNTTLAVLAGEDTKLNDIHDRTGFSRAKISVYLKNLIQMDVVEKLFSYSETNHQNAKKGLYAIREPFLSFWYRFCFPNLTYMETLDGEIIWKNHVAPYLDAYMERYFIIVCKEYLDLMNLYGKLPIQYEMCGSWYGKKGNLDVVAMNHSKKSLIGKCKWSNEALSEEDLKELITTMETAGLDSDYYYLFSKNGFTDSMLEKEKQMENIILTDMSSL